MIRWPLLIACLLLNACTNLPRAIKDAPVGDLQFGSVQEDISAYSGSAVRWGGTIVTVENEEHSTWVQVLSYPLNRFGQPMLEEPVQGRFLVQSRKFLDPAIYIKGLEITVAGMLNGSAERMVGKKSITLPVVQAEENYLWPDYDRGGYRFSRYRPYYYDHYPYRYYHHRSFYRHPHRYHGHRFFRHYACY